jgi:RecJ-like exonuclease
MTHEPIPSKFWLKGQREQVDDGLRKGEMLCPNCRGSGEKHATNGGTMCCPMCGGFGTVPKAKR